MNSSIYTGATGASGAPKTASEVAAEWRARRSTLTTADLEGIAHIQKALVASPALTVTFDRVSHASIVYLRTLGFEVLEESPVSSTGQTVRVSVKVTPPTTSRTHSNDCTCGECWKS